MEIDQYIMYSKYQNYMINPLTYRSDRNEISLYNINTLVSRPLTRITKVINKGFLLWCKTKFPDLTLKEMYVTHIHILGVKVLTAFISNFYNSYVYI